MFATPVSAERVQKYVFNFEMHRFLKKRPIYPILLYIPSQCIACPSVKPHSSLALLTEHLRHMRYRHIVSSRLIVFKLTGLITHVSSYSCQ